MRRIAANLLAFAVLGLLLVGFTAPAGAECLPAAAQLEQARAHENHFWSRPLTDDEFKKAIAFIRQVGTDDGGTDYAAGALIILNTGGAIFAVGTASEFCGHYLVSAFLLPQLLDELGIVPTEQPRPRQSI
jgi:hypothetical protein